ncbi:MAG: alpha/beta hydrolase [Microbispora sp.]|nr:alpha/beta hydrolase [Microbispora sp.]
MTHITSADGTTIAFDRSGEGPAVIFVQGGFTDRSHPTWSGLAAALSPHFTVYNYDRRGRGGSGDNENYAVEREVEDLAALIKDAGGEAFVFGGSSGGALALEAAARGLAITKLAVYEPPYIVGDSRDPLPDDFQEQLSALVKEGRRGDAAELFMVQASQIPAEMVAGMRTQPFWPDVEAVAHTLPYEAAVVGRGNRLPAERLAGITIPTLALAGGNSPEWLRQGAKAVSETIRNAEYRVLEGQAHDVSPEALAPVLKDFFNG